MARLMFERSVVNAGSAGSKRASNPDNPGQTRRVIAEAAEWLVRLQADADAGAGAGAAADAELLAAWQRWHDADPQHAAVWRRYADLQRLVPAVGRNGAGSTLPPAAQALKAVASRRGRRQALKLLCGGGVAVAIGGVTWRYAATEGWLAQTRTAVGEQRAMTLADGTRLLLNTRTAIDVHDRRGGDTSGGGNGARTDVTLHAGEILVDNRQGGDGAGLRLHTRHGYVEPYSARLLLRQLPECNPPETLVAVQEGTARLLAGGRLDAALHAGEARRFDAAGFQPTQAWRERDLAWTQGVLIADDMRLDDLLRQLARYRHGFLDCDDDAAARRVTGTFRIHDTDRVLEALAHHLGLRLRYRTRYWVMLET
ncbi:hypothetical protein CEY04_11820 [Achromobacter sp. HZ28]|nr:hypothetical protein CEY05_20160 [Achromobacter sp. HZ34]OWT79640.1 hypothetical protein CEY04_11820 [Achromobacter sp. HZ28]